MDIKKEALKKMIPALKGLILKFETAVGEEEKEKKDGEEIHKMTDAELEDGTKIKIAGEVVEGSKVTIVAEDGSEIPAPDGEHKLKGGPTITVKDSLILKVAEAEKPAEVAAVSEFKAEESFIALKAEFDSLKAQLTEFMSQSNTASAAMSKEVELTKKTLSETFKVVEVLAGLPAEKEIETKSKFMSTKEDRLLGVVKVLGEIKGNK